MHWVTRGGIHLDRVASAWLIVRFVDPGATFGFVARGVPVPDGAIGFAVPGSRFPPHDESMCTMRRLLLAYDLVDPTLDVVADTVEVAVGRVLETQIGRGPDRDPKAVDMASALALMSEGMAVLHPDDHENLARSLALYDAMYAGLRAAGTPEREALPVDPAARIEALRSMTWPVGASSARLDRPAS